MAVKKLTNAQLAFLGHFADEWRSMIEIDPTAFDKHGFLKMRVITHIDFLRAWKLIECKVVDNMAPRRYRLTDAGREALDAANAERAESTATIDDISNTLKQVATLPPSDEVQRRLADMNARIEAEEKEEAARAEAHKDALYVVWSKKLCKPLTIPMPFNEAIDFAPNWDGIILRDVDELTARMDALKFEKQGQELQDALDESRRIAAQQVEDAARRIAELEAALHFYADAGNYPIGLGGVHYADFAISDDEGDRARAALGLKALEG